MAERKPESRHLEHHVHLVVSVLLQHALGVDPTMDPVRRLPEHHGLCGIAERCEDAEEAEVMSRSRRREISGLTLRAVCDELAVVVHQPGCRSLPILLVPGDETLVLYASKRT